MTWIMASGPAGQWAAPEVRARSTRASARWASWPSYQPPARGVAFHLSAAGIDLGQQPAALIGRQPGRDPHGTVTIRPGAQVAPLPQPPVSLAFVGDRRRL